MFNDIILLTELYDPLSIVSIDVDTLRRIQQLPPQSTENPFAKQLFNGSSFN